MKNPKPPTLPPPVTFLRERAPIAPGWLRFLAFFIDGFIISILSTLAVSPLTRKITEAQLLQDARQITLMWVVALVVQLAVYFFYGWISVALMSATPGMKIFNMSIIDSYTGRSIGWSTARNRVWAFWVAAFAGGFGYLGIFTDPMRRAWHDRFSETLVVRGHHKASQPSWVERFVAIGGLYGFYALMVLSFTMAARETLKKNGVDFSNLEVLEKAPVLKTEGAGDREPASTPGLEQPTSLLGLDPCEMVVRRLPRQIDGQTFIETRLVQFEEGFLPSECLGQAADSVLEKEKNNAVAYFAKALLAGDPKVRENYRSKSCEVDPSSRACRVIEIWNLSEKEKWDELRPKVVSLLKEKNDFASAWLTDLLIADFKFSEALSELAVLQVAPSRFSQSITLRSYLGVGREAEARAGMEAWLSIAENEDRQEPALILCALDTVGSCPGAESHGCVELEKAMKDRKEIGFAEAFSLGRYQICKRQNDLARASFEKGGPSLRGIAAAEDAWVQGKIAEAQSLYSKMLVDPSTPENAKSIALLRAAWIAGVGVQQYKAALDFLKQVNAHRWPLSWLTVSRQVHKSALDHEVKNEARGLAEYILNVNAQDKMIQEWLTSFKMPATRAAASAPNRLPQALPPKRPRSFTP